VSDAAVRRRASAAIGWLALGLLLAWTACVHHGIGPAKPGPDPRWYAPRAFFFASDAISGMLDPPALAFAALGLPSLVLAAAVVVGVASALAAALAVSCVVATGLFVFYGVIAPFPWLFFGWRGSAVLGLVAGSVGFALAAPLLARRWLALRWPARVAVYAPFVAFMLLFLRNATGTDATLPFAISPWPAVPVFGLEVAALCIAIGLAGTALGVVGTARRRSGTGGGLAGWVLAVAVPLAVLAAGSWLHLFPFRASLPLMAAVAIACALATGIGSRLGARDAASLAVRARSLGVAAGLVGIPLLAGQAWAGADYYRTREIQARQIIDALQVYFARENLYPDDLDALVAANDLERIPVPAIGFACLYDGSFGYQSFGTSFLLDFPAPRWVQCAYTPAPVLEDLDPEELAELEAEGSLQEAWSCPSKPPELW
jgi:hypothetical protein